MAQQGQHLSPPSQLAGQDIAAGMGVTEISENTTGVNDGIPAVSVSSPEPIKKQKRLVSFDVFMKYVTYREDHVDVSRVFSKECFEEWIENRKQAPKEPEESFRKALVAHVSGKDDRKPFAPEVEFEILKRLRESEPWPCFAHSLNGANKIGERGLKKSSLGYHEGKRKRVEEYVPVLPGVGRSFPNLAPHSSSGSAPLPYQYYQMPPPQMHMNPGMFQPYYHYAPQFYPPPPRYLPPPTKRPNTQSSARHSPEDNDKLNEQLTFCNEQIHMNGPSGDFAKVLTGFYSAQELLKLLEIIPGLFNSDIASKMNIDDRFRSQKHFLLPQEGTGFDDKKVVGKLVLDIFGVIMAADDFAGRFIEEPFGKNLFSLFWDPVERALALVHLLRVFLPSSGGRSTFVRWVLKLKNKPQVLLVKLLPGRERRLTCQFQDVSENFLHLFSRNEGL